ncbi:bifunctional enolase 2/transcriptional activator-like [Lotus japonicus]|uniref:bifunctional enolase 2/transcriptional activator-like n=1 Tax=Lotus japonicus TaxID=34305 RepID=UPI002587585B|nr:bifunctional enolase 2/transcriptional activator-like [Lotus japonicus]
MIATIQKPLFFWKKGESESVIHLSPAMNAAAAAAASSSSPMNYDYVKMMHIFKAGASVLKIPLYKHIANLAGNPRIVLPVPSFTVINRVSHAGNKLATQEFNILPVESSNFKLAMQQGIQTHETVHGVIAMKYGNKAVQVCDEGGFTLNIKEKECLELLKSAIDESEYTGSVFIGMDVAPYAFRNEDKTYDLKFKEDNNDVSQKISRDALKDLYTSFVKEYPIVLIEDRFDKDDLEPYAKLTEEVRDHVLIDGDVPLVSFLKRVPMAIESKSNTEICNCLMLKVSQMGSVTDCIKTVKMAKEHFWGVIACPGSGETEDTFIADLCVGLSMGQIKVGNPFSDPRLVIHLRLKKIEIELGSESLYAGWNFRHW